MIKRLFDLFWSITGIIVLLPIFVLISVIIKFDSKGPVFFLQNRVGRNNKDFKLVKFRTMYVNSDKKGEITIGANDSRITKTGTFLRKYKLDELPQLFNVLYGNMSLVGPRPEVRTYVDLYSAEQLKVLDVLPGITDYASIEYANENELLAKAENPEQFYKEVVMPDKLKLNMKYINEVGLFTDLKIIFKTLIRIIK
jgi:lipopolysaccharide/colanic/teichoic acid biosynthesis glycosyltransferase